MEESVTYQAILEEGGIKYMRGAVLRLGQEKFGPAGEDVVAALRLNPSEVDIIDDIVMKDKGQEELERLHRLAKRVLEVSSWQELMQVP